MKLHTVFVTFNRLELTKVAVESYLATVDLAYSYVIVDNRSGDGTREWVKSHPHLLLKRNYYPGYATNRGWEAAPADATHLHRADNDMRFLPGWCDEVRLHFSAKRRLGQLGLRTSSEERHCDWNTGGNCIIRRELFDAGLRYDERPWRRYPPGHSEDTYFSPAVKKMGWTWSRVSKPCLEMLSPDLSEREKWESDPYYVKSFSDRRIGEKPRGRRR